MYLFGEKKYSDRKIGMFESDREKTSFRLREVRA